MRVGRIAGWLAAAIALASAAGALLPFEPRMLGFAADMCFGATLHHAAAHGASDGTRLISTYGPLGFVYYPIYFPETFAWLVGLRAFLAAITCWALAWMGLSAWRSPWGAALAVVAAAPFFVAPDAWFLVLPLFALLFELVPGKGSPPALRVALGVALGLASLIKVTFLIAALLVLLPQAVTETTVRRRMPLTAIAAAAAATMTWFALGKGWRDWIAYLDWSLSEVAPGYARAMQQPTTTALVLFAAAVTAAALVAGAVLARERLGRGWWMSTAGLAAGLFLLFKAGFVRADTHVFITADGLLAVGALLTVLLGPTPRRLLGGVLLCTLLGGGLWLHALRVHGAPSFAYRPIPPLEALSRLRGVPDLLSGERLARAHELTLARTRERIPIEPLPGPVDIFPYAQNVLLAHGLAFRPRPVFQSYMTYTPRLARANADYLRSSAAPQWILFEVAPIDGRFPALEDAAAWPVLLTHYRLAGVVAERFALLARRPAPLAESLEPIGKLETSTGSAVPVPSSDAGGVWVQIDLGETVADRLATALLAAPRVFMDVTLQDSSRRSYRLIPAIARDGFFLSPLVGSTDDFLYFMRRPLLPSSGRAIKEFTLRVEPVLGLSSEQRTVAVEFWRLLVPARREEEENEPADR